MRTELAATETRLAAAETELETMAAKVAKLENLVDTLINKLVDERGDQSVQRRGESGQNS